MCCDARLIVLPVVADADKGDYVVSGSTAPKAFKNFCGRELDSKKKRENETSSKQAWGCVGIGSAWEVPLHRTRHLGASGRTLSSDPIVGILSCERAEPERAAGMPERVA